jgi:hypothetical protein
MPLTPTLAYEKLLAFSQQDKPLTKARYAKLLDLFQAFVSSLEAPATATKKANKVNPSPRKTPAKVKAEVRDIEAALGGDFITTAHGTAHRLELPREVIELLQLKQPKTPTTQNKMQPYLFYRYQGHLCLTTPALLESREQVPVFKTSKGTYNRTAFCQVLTITDKELTELLASPPADHADEPPHTLATLQELLGLCSQCFDTNWKTATSWLNSSIWILEGDTPVWYLKQGKWGRVNNVLGAIYYGNYA